MNGPTGALRAPIRLITWLGVILCLIVAGALPSAASAHGRHGHGGSGHGRWPSPPWHGHGHGHSPQPPPFAAKLKPRLEAEMGRMQVPGAIVLVKAPGKGSWLAGLGTSDLSTGAPMNVDSYVRVGSNTKPLTATVILQYAEEGKLDLDDPVSKYLPGVVPNGENITIRELLNMTSGLADYTEAEGVLEGIEAEPQRVWTANELTSIAFAKPPDFAPGAGVEYSSTNYILLSEIIEKISHRPWEEAIERNVLRPLGMTETTLPAATDSSLPDPHPRGYMLEGSGQPPVDATEWNPSWGGAAGDAISTVHDMAIWAEALATGRLLSPAMQAERLQLVPLTETVGYGLGIVDFGNGLIGHNGGIPGFESFVAYEPIERATIVVFVNQLEGTDGSAPADTLALVAREVLAETSA